MAKERIDKLLSNIGIGTRKEVKKLIKSGLVTVNNKLILDPGHIIDTTIDNITFNGEKIIYKDFIYIMMNKPSDIICATYDPLYKTVIDLLPQEYRSRKLFPVGRLDKDTVGMLILSNDGLLAHKLLSPKNHIIKKYYAEVSGYIDEDDIQSFNKGIVLDDGYKTLPAKLEIISSNDKIKAYVYIREGKYHQIKRMFKELGCKVLYLKRISMGNINLDENLKEGEWRELTDDELNRLKNFNK